MPRADCLLSNACLQCLPRLLWPCGWGEGGEEQEALDGGWKPGLREEDPGHPGHPELEPR